MGGVGARAVGGAPLTAAQAAALAEIVSKEQVHEQRTRR
jgi:hypothetical protein